MGRGRRGEEGALLPKEPAKVFGGSTLLCEFSVVGSVNAGSGAVTTGPGVGRARERGREMVLGRATVLCCQQGESRLWDPGRESGLFAAPKLASFHAEQTQRH